ncbi:MAG TPA: SIS domain-containing protein [Vicinamibacterales bacterium]|jgi:D-sedoheptulose 7-phosphate isomerase|nr:SIS domain-containing protein [Vicinamibacterales bacterium]
METWAEYVETIAQGLRGLAVTDRQASDLSPPVALSRWVAMTHQLHERDGCLFIIGNGGSAGMASHMAADACKNGHLRALALNDAAMITATSNDLSYDQVFSLPLERLARKGDLLVTISSSGNSPNIVRALETARGMGLEVVTLSGQRPDNRSRGLGDLNFYVPLQRYGWAESAHQILLHYWFDQYLNTHRQDAI